MELLIEEQISKKEEKEMIKRKTIEVKRFFTDGKTHPFENIEWSTSRIKITGNDKVLFDYNVEHPSFWDNMAVRICADKYFKINNIDSLPNGGERSVREVIHRVAFGISKRGLDYGYLDEESRNILYDEICYILLHQLAAFNSPVFFNMGLYDVYKFKGNSKAKRWAIKDRDGEVYEQKFEYENPQSSACFLTKVKDELINGEDGIYDWIQTEMSIFANGSGSGVNVSRIRGEGESITGGGKSSGLISFLRIADTSAGAIKSGGKTRRAAKMLMLDDNHPDLLEFIQWKKKEEFKSRTLILNGYISNFGSDNYDGAYQTVQGQNANNSIRISDELMNAIINDSDWELKYAKTGEVKSKIKARKIMDEIVDSAWECADPGLFYKGTVEKWNTTPLSGEIETSNPCCEFLRLNGESCNLASINLIRFLNKTTKTFDIEKYIHVIETLISSMEILVGVSSYPAKYIAEATRDFRPLGLGYCNIGGLMMALGYPYDSDNGRSIISTLTSLESAVAYRQSAKIASIIGPFKEYNKNKKEFLNVIKMHGDYTKEIKCKTKFTKDIKAVADQIWEETYNLGSKHGFRNSQVVVIAPTGTIMFIMGTTNNGIEPPFALTMFKQMSDGSTVNLICNEMRDGLEALGYSEIQINDIEEFVTKNGHVEGAPHLDEKHVSVFDTANMNGTGKRYIRAIAHVEAIAAATPFVSGGISKTINLPESATKEDIKECYIQGWKLGCKALSVYRDGSKWSQPLSSSKGTDSNTEKYIKEARRIKERINISDFKDKEGINIFHRNLLERRKAPTRAISERVDFNIGGENIHYHIPKYPDGKVAEVWLEVGKEGETVKGLVSTMGRLLSIAIQYGVPIEQLCDTMLGQQYQPSGFIGKNDFNIRGASSIADLTAKLLLAISNGNGKNESYVKAELANETEELSIVSAVEQARKAGYSGLTCKKCGSYRSKGSMKCGVCLDCGQEYGTCSG